MCFYLFSCLPTPRLILFQNRSRFADGPELSSAHDERTVLAQQVAVSDEVGQRYVTDNVTVLICFFRHLAEIEYINEAGLIGAQVDFDFQVGGMGGSVVLA